jgi:hypothetical protein
MQLFLSLAHSACRLASTPETKGKKGGGKKAENNILRVMEQERGVGWLARRGKSHKHEHKKVSQSKKPAESRARRRRRRTRSAGGEENR